MYNRYIGNTGKFYRVNDDTEKDKRGSAATSPEAVTAAGAAVNAVRRSGGSGGIGGLGFFDGLNGLKLPFGLNMSDVTLLLIFLFLYLQSGDEEFLILLAAVVLCDFF